MMSKRIGLIEYKILLSYYGRDNVGFRFVLGKQQKTGKIINEYITLRLKHKKLFKEQLNRLDTQNHHRRIDNTERDRLKTILEAKYCQQQEEDWNHIQERIQ